MSATTFAKISDLIDELERDEQLHLIEEIVHRLRLKETPAESTTPARLYGFLKNRVPANCDIDQALAEIRSEWTQELEEA